MWTNHKFEEVLDTLKESLVVQKEILAILRRRSPATEIQIVFGKQFQPNPNQPNNKGNKSMPLQLPDNQTDKYYILGTDPAGVLGAPLASGQTIAVVASDPATVLITPDASPAVTPAGLVTAVGAAIPAGLQSVASGTVASAQPPANPNVPVPVTATVSNADGSVAETISDTVTIAPGTASTIGILFGPAATVSAVKAAPKPIQTSFKS